MEVDMKIKRYTAVSMRAALAQVRAEQGPDAVILSSRRSEEGIEVIAAIDYDEALFADANRQRAPAHAPAPAAVSATSPVPAPAPVVTPARANVPAPVPVTARKPVAASATTSAATVPAVAA